LPVRGLARAEGRAAPLHAKAPRHNRTSSRVKNPTRVWGTRPPRAGRVFSVLGSPQCLHGRQKLRVLGAARAVRKARSFSFPQVVNRSDRTSAFGHSARNQPNLKLRNGAIRTPDRPLAWAWRSSSPEQSGSRGGAGRGAAQVFPRLRRPRSSRVLVPSRSPPRQFADLLPFDRGPTRTTDQALGDRMEVAEGSQATSSRYRSRPAPTLSRAPAVAEALRPAPRFPPGGRSL